MDFPTTYHIKYTTLLQAETNKSQMSRAGLRKILKFERSTRKAGMVCYCELQRMPTELFGATGCFGSLKRFSALLSSVSA